MLLLLWACTSAPPEPVSPAAPEPQGDPSVVAGPFGLVPGVWSGWMVSEGGPIHFGFEIAPGSACGVTLDVGGVRHPVGATECLANTLSMKFLPYEGSLAATIGPDGRTLRGHWSGPGNPGLPFEAVVGPAPGVEWISEPEGAPRDLALALADGTVGHLTVAPGPVAPGLLGTVITPGGDWGALAGGWTPEGLELSGFDGSQPVLVRLTPDDNGRLRGHTWRGRSAALELVERDIPAAVDGWRVLPLEGVDLGGQVLPIVGREPGVVPDTGPRVIHVMGSWSPNSNDAAPVIERIQREVPGVRVVVLAWEADAPAPRAERQLVHFSAVHGVTSLIYRVDRALPVPAWPTTLFVRADGTVQSSHVGFVGPAAGVRHTELVERMLTEARSLVP